MSHLNLGHVIQVINEGDPDLDPIMPPPPVTRPALASTGTSGSQRLKAVSLMLLLVIISYQDTVQSRLIFGNFNLGPM